MGAYIALHHGNESVFLCSVFLIAIDLAYIAAVLPESLGAGDDEEEASVEASAGGRGWGILGRGEGGGVGGGRAAMGDGDRDVIGSGSRMVRRRGSSYKDDFSAFQVT